MSSRTEQLGVRPVARDILLVTVDCWRHDAPAEMPQLQTDLADATRTDAVTAAPATRGSFPAILNSRYYPEAYTGFNQLRPGQTSLPEALSAAGYETAGFVGSNPFLSAWADRFDSFWNDDLDAESSVLPQGLASAVESLRTGLDYARMRSRVTATDLAQRAARWYDSTAGPRFLWVHLMDVHVPFLPGLRRGLSEGALATFLAHLKFVRDPASLSAAEYATLERLYWHSVDRLDETIGKVLSVVDDDALVAVTGDHGEEFDHGEFGHARLYDECVRVPLFVRNGGSEFETGGAPVRHLDLPVGLLDAVDAPVPEDWTGEPLSTEPTPAFMLNHSPRFGAVYAGVRTDRWKVIRTFDAETMTHEQTELYDLRADPGETTDLTADRKVPGALQTTLDDFLARPEIADGLHEDGSAGSGDEQPDAVVADRLEALGYR